MMDKINLEIIEYIQNDDLDENIKSFFINAIVYEMRNPERMRYKETYNSLIERSISW